MTTTPPRGSAPPPPPTPSRSSHSATLTCCSPRSPPCCCCCHVLPSSRAPALHLPPRRRWHSPHPLLLLPQGSGGGRAILPLSPLPPLREHSRQRRAPLPGRRCYHCSGARRRRYAQPPGTAPALGPPEDTQLPLLIITPVRPRSRPQHCRGTLRYLVPHASQIWLPLLRPSLPSPPLRLALLGVVAALQPPAAALTALWTRLLGAPARRHCHRFCLYQVQQQAACSASWPRGAATSASAAASLRRQLQRRRRSQQQGALATAVACCRRPPPPLQRAAA